jgi:hypothetical protein
MDKDTLSIDHIDPRWAEGRDYQLICGLECEDNLLLCPLSYNATKQNKFVPYRIEALPAPRQFGDVGEFLIDGEWVVCEFGGDEWHAEARAIGCGSTQNRFWINNPEQHREACSRGGIVSGRNNVLNGHLESLRTPEHQSRASKMARERESYETKAARALNIPREKKIEGARKVGRDCVLNKKGIHSPEFLEARKKPIVLTLPTGEEVQFDSIKKAAEEYGLLRGKLSEVCNGKRKQHKGYTARFVDTEQ